MANLEVFYRPNNTLTVKAEVRGAEEMFQVLGPLQEILGEMKCCKCRGESVRFVHRKADGHDVYELLCETKKDNGIPCRAKLALGMTTDRNLFPRRYAQVKKNGEWVPETDADGKRVYLPDNGWVRWDSKQEKYV